MKKSPYNIFKLLGPGLITGASDDDPSGIATYSQVGAKFGFDMLWTMLISYPMMTAVQEISARIGRITGRGLAGNMRRFYSAWITLPLVALLVAANIFNLGADIIAMGTALELVIGGSATLYGVLFTIGSLVLQIFMPYTKYSNYLKWLTLALFAYVATAFVIHVPWGQAYAIPFFQVFSEPRKPDGNSGSDGDYNKPYLFFWQASTEVEEVEAHRDSTH
jgi:Mn2+ and Fe2+ transporters of the NRAMP family